MDMTFYPINMNGIILWADGTYYICHRYYATCISICVFRMFNVIVQFQFLQNNFNFHFYNTISTSNSLFYPIHNRYLACSQAIKPILKERVFKQY